MDGDCEENHLWIVEPAEIQIDLLSAKSVRVINLSGHDKVICKDSEVGQCAPVEAVINNEQLPESAEMSVKDQKEFGENVEKWVVSLAAPERNKAK